jgi:hypothetical protein
MMAGIVTRLRRYWQLRRLALAARRARRRAALREPDYPRRGPVTGDDRHTRMASPWAHLFNRPRRLPTVAAILRAAHQQKKREKRTPMCGPWDDWER